PAEALGAKLKFYEDGAFQFPQVAQAWVKSTQEIPAVVEDVDVRGSGRIGLICEAISVLKEDIGNEVAVSGTIPGPYTLMLYLCSTGNLFTEMKKEPQIVLEALSHVSSFLAKVGSVYRNAGVDFITIHDMGGSPGFIGPTRYEQFVLPAEKLLIEK